MTEAPSDHLLRTFASVPVQSSVLIVGTDDGRHTDPLRQLGFPISMVTSIGTDHVEEQEQSLRNHTGSTTHHYTRLGEVPDDTYDWVVAYGSHRQADMSVEGLLEDLIEIRRVTRPGGWAYIAIHTGSVRESNSELILAQYRLMEKAGFELAEKSEVIVERGGKLVRGIFRRVDEDTPL